MSSSTLVSRITCEALLQTPENKASLQINNIKGHTMKLNYKHQQEELHCKSKPWLRKKRNNHRWGPSHSLYKYIKVQNKNKNTV